MKLIYLDSTMPDLAWYRTYYGSVFPEGAGQAAARYVKTIDNLTNNPYIGQPIGQDGLHKLAIPRTPFSVFYRVTASYIEIVRIWDQRADPAKLGFEEEAAVLS
jgi:plasmid stabilization system protein ParE